jgi:hypothetical protein
MGVVEAQLCTLLLTSKGRDEPLKAWIALVGKDDGPWEWAFAIVLPGCPQCRSLRTLKNGE